MASVREQCALTPTLGINKGVLMKMLKLVILVAALPLLQSCATQISPERIASADYGSPPPENYEQLIKDHFNKILIDPTSPIYEFDKPRKGYTKQSSMFNTQENFGWRVCGTVNSKNRFGGYVGRVPFFALFRGERVVELISGEITDNKYGINIKNSAIEEACRR